MKRFSFSIGLLLSILPNVSLAGTHWVSPTGTASWAGCQSATPLDSTAACSLNTANANAVAGDTIYLRGNNGPYNGQFIVPTHSGSPGAMITYTNYSNENVVMTDEFSPNRTMESAPWPAVGGAVVSQSAAQAWLGSYSTAFTTTVSGQGIQSPVLTLPGNGQIVFYCVYSAQSSVHVHVQNGSGSGVAYDSDVALFPNLWTCTNTSFFNGTGGNQAYVSFTSPVGAPSGTWYVDEVRFHRYQESIEIYGISYVKVNGVQVSDAYDGFTMIDGASFNEISNSTFTDIDAYSTNIITSNYNGGTAPSQYNWIHGNVIHDNGYVNWTGTSCNENGDELRLGISNNDDSSSYNLIEENVFYHTSHDQILASTPFNTIRNNIFHNEDWFPDHYNGCGLVNAAPKLGARNILLQQPLASSTTFSGYNFIEGNRIGFAGTPYTQGANNIESSTNGNIIRYNYLYKADASGYEFKPPVSGNTPMFGSYNHIFNNTFYANGGGPSILNLKQAAVQINWPGNPGPGVMSPSIGNVFTNNIYYGNTAIYSGDVSSSTFFGVEGNISIGNFTGNPNFTNPDLSNVYSLTLPDLSIPPTSPAIGVAIPLTHVGATDSSHGTTLIVNDASFFQDGTWAPPGHLQADWIAVGSTQNVVQIASIPYPNLSILSSTFTLTTIILKNPISRNPGDPVWLYSNSSGQCVLSGSAPSAGAFQFGCTPYPSPTPPPSAATPGLVNAYSYPNPAIGGQTPIIRVEMGVLSSITITIFDASGRTVNSTSLSGASPGITANGIYYYDYRWTGHIASGIYFAVIHGKAADGTIIRARTKIAVVR